MGLWTGDGGRKHGPDCCCSSCAAKRYVALGDRLIEESAGTTGMGLSTGGSCGDCGGTGDCIHCDGGSYPRRDGTKALCGKCHGRGNRKHPYKCHVCKGTGYGGSRCSTPTYNETVARLQGGGRSSGGSGRGGRVAKGVASAAIAFGGAMAHPQQDSDTTEQHYGQSSLQSEGERRGAQASDATRDKGYRGKGTSQR
jgi:hypothetical protein